MNAKLVTQLLGPGIIGRPFFLHSRVHDEVVILKALVTEPARPDVVATAETLEGAKLLEIADWESLTAAYWNGRVWTR